MPQHVFEDTAGPTDPPDKVGSEWIDTATGEIYIAVGTGSAADWVKIISTLSPAAGGFRFTADGRVLLQWRAADGGDDLFYELRFKALDGLRVLDIDNVGEA